MWIVTRVCDLTSLWAGGITSSLHCLIIALPPTLPEQTAFCSLQAYKLDDSVGWLACSDNLPTDLSVWALEKSMKQFSLLYQRQHIHTPVRFYFLFKEYQSMYKTPNKTIQRHFQCFHKNYTALGYDTHRNILLILIILQKQNTHRVCDRMKCILFQILQHIIISVS